MHINGILVQDISKEMTPFLIKGTFKFSNHIYSGVARYKHFPLSVRLDATSKNLTERMAENVYKDIGKEEQSLPLWVITDMKLYGEYIKHCEHLNIQTRSLFVESTRYEPHWAGETPNVHLLGYEIVNPNLCVQDICRLLNETRYKGFAKLLNKDGLFPDYETANSFYNEFVRNDSYVAEDNDILIAKISRLV